MTKVSKIEHTEAGEQFLIPGVKPISATDRLKLQAKAPLTPRLEQKPCNQGLFDEAGRAQLDLVELAKQKGK